MALHSKNGYALTKTILKHKPDLKAIDKKGNTLLHRVVRSDKIYLIEDEIVKVIKILLDAGVSINQKNYEGDTALHIVAKQDHYYKTAKELLTNGADLNIRNKYGDTPFSNFGYNLMFYYNNDLVKLFIEHGADPDIYSGRGKTLLYIFAGYYFADEYNIDSFTTLINNGADINKFDKSHEYTAFTNAVYRNWSGNTLTLELFLNNGANVNLENKNGNTAIHAVKHESSLDILLKAGADINHKNNDGNTALHLLCSCNCKKYSNNEDFQHIKDKESLINEFIKRGASINIKNNEGITVKWLLSHDCN